MPLSAVSVPQIHVRWDYDSCRIMLESESIMVKGHLQPQSTIDHKDSVVNERFISQFREEYLGKRLCSGQKQSGVEQVVHIGIDRSVHPVPLNVDLNCCSSTAT